MPRRVAVVTTSWPSHEDDPAGHFVLAETRALEAAGDRVVLFAPAHGGAFGWPGVAARVRQDPLRALSAAHWMTYATYRLRRAEVDAVVCHWAIPSAWPVAHGAPAPIEVVSHGGDVRLLAGLPGPLRTRLTRTIARRCASWRFVSSTLADQLLAALDPATSRLVERVAAVRAPSFEMPDVREEAARLRRALSPARTAVVVGRLVESKRVDRAIAYVADGDEFDQLVVVGDGPERRRLESHARASRARVVFVGTVPRHEALAWIGASDAMIHASVAEGLSTVVREAEMLGKRVVHLR